MTVNKNDLLKRIIDLEDQEVLHKIDLLVQGNSTSINGVKAIPHQAIPDDLDIEALKKEQDYGAKNLVAFMENWDYDEWKDIDVEQAIKAID